MSIFKTLGYVETAVSTGKTGRRVEYRLVGSDDGHEWRNNKDLRTQTDWDGVVYGGDDGSVLAFQPKPPSRGNRQSQQQGKRWIKLKQTRTKSHGYWSVSVPRRSGRFEKCYVHRLILFAFEGSPDGNKKIALHKDGKPDNNSRTNLAWGDESDNMHSKKEYRSSQLHEMQILAQCGVRLDLRCRAGKWVGTLYVASEKPIKLPDLGGLLRRTNGYEVLGAQPAEVVSDMLYRFRKFIFDELSLPEKEQAFYPTLRSSREGYLYPKGFEVGLGERIVEWNSGYVHTHTDSKLRFSDRLLCYPGT